MAGFQHCIDTVRREAPGLTDDEAMDLLEEVGGIAEAKQADARVADLNEAVAEAVRSRADDEVRRAINEKRQAAMRYRTRTVLRGRVRQLIRDGRSEEVAKYLESLTVGIPGDSPFKASIERSARSIEQRAHAVFFDAVRRAGVDDREAVLFLRSRDASRLLIRESDEPGSTGNPLVKAVAEAMEEANEYLRGQANRYGADIGRMPGYLMKQAHDADRMVRAGKGAWIDAIKPLLDWDRTFGPGAGDARADAFLSAAFDNIVHGKMSDIGGDLSAAPGMTGPRNMAAGLSHSRKLHFRRNGEAAWTYMQAFGTRDVGNAFTYGIDGMARSIGAMIHLGPNPEFMLREMIGFAKDELRGDVPAFRALERNEGAVMDLYEEAIGGGGRLPSALDWRGKMARAVNWSKNITGSALLGGTTLASLADMGTAATRLSHAGVPFFDAHRAVLSSLISGRGDPETRAIAQSLNVGMEGLISGVQARWTGDAGENGQGAFLVGNVMRITGMNWLNDAMKTAVGLSLSHHIAGKADGAFDALPDNLRREMEAYGITAAHWEDIRAARTTTGDRTFIDPRVMEGDAQRLFQEFVVGFTDSAILTPGARTRRLTRGTADRGTFLGEASVLFMHLKSFSVTYFQEHLSRFYKSGRLQFGYAAHLTLSALVYGYIAGALKDIFAGREPRPLDDAEMLPGVLADAWLNGGGAGYYGDLVFALMDDDTMPGQGILEQTAGPGLGLVFDVRDLVQEGMEGDSVGAAAEASRIAKTVIPGANIFYSRWAVDYMLFWPMAEYLRPGFARRVERRAREERGHEYLNAGGMDLGPVGASRLY